MVKYTARLQKGLPSTSFGVRRCSSTRFTVAHFSRGDSAIALAEFGDVVLALPFPVDALVTLGLPLVVVIRDLVLALLRYGALGLLLAVVGRLCCTLSASTFEDLPRRSCSTVDAAVQ